MSALVQIESHDRRLLESISSSMEDAARLSGDWLACRPGCTQCCMGPFAITALDAMRLRKGLRLLRSVDPARAAEVAARAAACVRQIADQYPGDTESGELFDPGALPVSMDDVPCPALHPESGLCELYEHRPITCRTFGPVTRVADNAFGACELCYQGASDEQMAACAVETDPDGVEAGALAMLRQQGQAGITIVTYALAAEAAPGP